MKDPNLDVIKDNQTNVHVQIVKPAITGSAIIDGEIIQICPEIIDITEENRIIISNIIRSYLFNNENSFIHIIEDILNETAAEFITGIGIIIDQENIIDIEGIEAYLNSTEDKQFTPSSIYDAISKDI